MSDEIYRSTPELAKPHFLAHSENGFSMQFPNGIQVSVIWNKYAYAEFRCRFNKGEVNMNDPFDFARSATAEVMVVHKDGRPIKISDFDCDGDIYPNMSPENVARLLAAAATINPDTDLKTVHIY